jgi:hypothetical protein
MVLSGSSKFYKVKEKKDQLEPEIYLGFCPKKDQLEILIIF